MSAAAFRRLLAPLLSLARRALASPVFWGLLGWALLILRYASEVVHPRYGG